MFTSYFHHVDSIQIYNSHLISYKNTLCCMLQRQGINNIVFVVFASLKYLTRAIVSMELGD